MGRRCRGNKDDCFQLKRFERFARQNQVTMVNRIESATEDANLFQAMKRMGELAMRFRGESACSISLADQVAALPRWQTKIFWTPNMKRNLTV